MKKSDKKILNEIQKNANVALNIIEAVSEKVYDDALLHELSKERLLYSTIHNKASHRLQCENEEGHKSSVFEEAIVRGAINLNTITNCSTSKIAELMIQGSMRGMTGMWRVINQNRDSSIMSMEIAKELIGFEEKNIKRLREFL